ncbi:hypothetical protein GCM10010124_28200 [Pilimelia terevasa]|uniref:Carrier domain-containing protein n=1 Tax=Pilimelia terevasa TaxID=53372 RepID=A0A8J3BRN5_9ACTN|nr:acyl carrier protein [Pilimelia terevasa]GGK33971.1 hypothetical protein GCM10010124_28200 [Pilimelia terevasa]
MSRDEIFVEVVDLACAVEPRVVRQAVRLDDTPFTAYGITSMSMLQLTARVEDRFAVRISDGEALRAGTPLRLVGLIAQKLRTVARS